MQNEGLKKYSMTGGPKGLPILGCVLDAVGGPLVSLARNSITYGDIIPFTVLGRKIIQLNHPDLISYVLIENHKNYRKSASYRRLESALGNGLFTSEGEKWRRDRQSAQPMFRREQIENYYFEVTQEVAKRFKKRWLDLTREGPAVIDLTEEMANFTSEIIVRLIFGKDQLNKEDIAFLQETADTFLRYEKNERIFPNVDIRQLFRTPAYRKLRAQLDRLDDFIEKLIVKYKAGQVADQFNMMAMLLQRQKENPEHMNDQNVRDQCVTMIFAGYESTSLLLQWTFYSLDMYPHVTQNLREEIRESSIFKTPEQLDVDYQGLMKLDYLSAVFKEALRMYPALWVTGREPLADDIIGGYSVRPGDIVLLPQLIMQRHPRFWDRPHAFLPERFSGNKEADIHEGAYFPFSQGPRKCIGLKLTELEAKMFLTLMLPSFDIHILNSLGNGMDPGLTLSVKYPFQAKLTRR